LTWIGQFAALFFFLLGEYTMKTYKDVTMNDVVVASDDSLGMIVTWNKKTQFNVYDVWDSHNVLDVDNFIAYVNGFNSAREVAKDYLMEIGEELAA